MSIPIKACMVVKAAKGDEKAFENLIERMKLNANHGAFKVYPCDCEVACSATDEELEAFDARVKESLKDE